MQELVRKGYNAGKYGETYRKKPVLTDFEKSFLKCALKLLVPRNRLLDLGSGPGVPYDHYFTNHDISVTGIDLSEKHIAEARVNVPAAHYILGDFIESAIEKDRYACIIALYSIIHVPRKFHYDLLSKIYKALPDNGVFLVTMGTKDTPYKEKDAFCESKMAWSFYDTQTNIDIILNCGFSILKSANEIDFGSLESHLWVLAQK